MSGGGFTREEVAFDSAGVRCAAWFYRPEGTGPSPVVVMAHGFGGVRELGLAPYAERFAAAGYAVLVFDYRFFGASGGEPRQLLDVDAQRADWEAAVAYARGLPGVDGARVALWGTSFSGGHVVEVALRAPGVVAVISQVPHLSGPATALLSGPVALARLTLAALRDRARALVGRAPLYVRTIGAPGALAAMTAPGELEAYRRLAAGTEVRDEVAARVLLRVPFYSPGARAARLDLPWLVQVAERDRTTPPGPAIAAAHRAPRAELRTYPIGHFDAYVPPAFEQVVGDQLAFLRAHVPVGG